MIYTLYYLTCVMRFFTVQGADRFCDNIKDMIGYKPLTMIKYSWLYGTPLVCSVGLLRRPELYIF